MQHRFTDAGIGKHRWLEPLEAILVAEMTAGNNGVDGWLYRRSFVVRRGIAAKSARLAKACIFPFL